MRFFCPRNVFSYKQRPAFSRRGFVSAWLDSASQAGGYEALWKNSLNDTTIMQSLAYGPLDKSKQRWEKMFTGTRRRQWSSLWCSPRSGTRASRGEGSRTWRLRLPRPGITMRSRSWSIDNTLKISFVSQLCSWLISLLVTLIDIVVLIVMMDGHSHAEYSDRNSSKYKKTDCKVNWRADLYDRW